MDSSSLHVNDSVNVWGRQGVLERTDKRIVPSSSSDFDELEICLQKKEFQRIIEDQHLFWQAFCKSVYPSQCEAPCLKTNKNPKISTWEAQRIKNIEEFVEKIRALFLKALETKGKSEFYVMYLYQRFYLDSSLDSIMSKRGSQTYGGNPYIKFIERDISTLAEFCGAGYKKITLSRPSFISQDVREFNLIQISLKKECHLTHSIESKSLTESIELASDMYSLYKCGLYSDLSLFVNDKKYDVHTTVLYLRGGEVFKRMLSSGMKEALESSILLKDYSEKTVEAFIEYIYLGPEEFSKKVISSENHLEVNLIELFRFANVYQTEMLVECCINLMSLFATSYDITVIEEVLCLYPNERLKKLCNCLRKEKVQYIKV